MIEGIIFTWSEMMMEDCEGCWSGHGWTGRGVLWTGGDTGRMVSRGDYPWFSQEYFRIADYIKLILRQQGTIRFRKPYGTSK